MFHDGSNYDYHFLIKELADEFDSLGENTGKYISFLVPIGKKVTIIEKNGEKITNLINYNLLTVQDL